MKLKLLFNYIIINKMEQSMDNYYLINKVWVYGNIIMIIPFIVSCIFRFKNPDINKKLWTDHLARFFLLFTVLFYPFDMAIKYPVDKG